MPLVLTVDGLQVAIVDQCGPMYQHQRNMLKKQFCDEMLIGSCNIKWVDYPMKGLKKWTPKKH